MKQEIFRGIATALATPMELDGAIDYEAYGRLIDWQIDAGVAGLVACGTTGESATMTEAEHKEVIRFTVERAAGRVPVIAGTGSNCTAKAVAMTQYACSVGADACLLVTPYYNKATQAGLIAHYTAIADASDKPLILYNVPSRTGCNLLPATCAALADHPRIAAVKEASGNIGQIVEVAALGRRPARHLFRQRRPYCACPLHGRLRLHLRAVQRSSPGGPGPLPPVLRRGCGRGCRPAVQASASGERPVFRGQPNPRECRSGRHGLWKGRRRACPSPPWRRAAGRRSWQK